MDNTRHIVGLVACMFMLALCNGLPMFADGRDLYIDPATGHPIIEIPWDVSNKRPHMSLIYRTPDAVGRLSTYNSKMPTTTYGQWQHLLQEARIIAVERPQDAEYCDEVILALDPYNYETLMRGAQRSMRSQKYTNACMYFRLAFIERPESREAWDALNHAYDLLIAETKRDIMQRNEQAQRNGQSCSPAEIQKIIKTITKPYHDLFLSGLPEPVQPDAAATDPVHVPRPEQAKEGMPPVAPTFRRAPDGASMRSPEPIAGTDKSK